MVTTESTAHTLHDLGTNLELTIDAPSLRSLYAEAGRALADIMAGVQCTGAVGGDVECVMLQAPDTEALLIGWMNELIFRSGMRGRAYTELNIDYVDSNRLTASVRGVPVEHFATKVKSASWEGLAVEKVEPGYRAKVKLDL
jgi:SHS2 domain-containing protein